MEPRDELKGATWQRLVSPLPLTREQFKQLVLEFMRNDPEFRQVMQRFVDSED